MMARRTFIDRWYMAIGGAVMGVIYGVAHAVGGHTGTGLQGGLLIFGFWLVVSIGRGEVSTLLRGGGDERQRQIQAESAQITLMVVVAVSLGGALWEAAHGSFGKFGWMCSITGLSVIVVPILLRRWR